MWKPEQIFSVTLQIRHLDCHPCKDFFILFKKMWLILVMGLAQTNMSVCYACLNLLPCSTSLKNHGFHQALAKSHLVVQHTIRKWIQKVSHSSTTTCFLSDFQHSIPLAQGNFNYYYQTDDKAKSSRVKSHSVSQT